MMQREPMNEQQGGIDDPPQGGGEGKQELWPPAFGAWIKLALCYQKGSRHLAGRLRPLGLTVPQFDALANLYLDDGVSQQILAERLLVTKGNVTGLLNRLAERGLVERRADPNDRRANRIVLTGEGRRVTIASLEVQRGVINEMLGTLVPTEQQQLRSLLTRIIDGLDGS